jgi:hypothetical protein
LIPFLAFPDQFQAPQSQSGMNRDIEESHSWMMPNPQNNDGQPPAAFSSMQIIM